MNSARQPLFIAIRAVSDLADEAKNDDYRKKALTNAGQVLLKILDGIDLKTYAEQKLHDFLVIHHISHQPRTSVLSSLSPGASEDFQNYKVRTLEVNLIQVEPAVFLPQAVEKQSEAVKSVNQILDEHPNTKLGYFSLAHIPFAVDLGFSIQRQPVKYFELNRLTGTWEALADKEQPLSIVEDFTDPLERRESTEIAILVEISTKIREQDLMNIGGLPVIKLSLESPKLDAIESSRQVEQFAGRFRATIDRLKNENKSLEAIHLFYGVQPV